MAASLQRRVRGCRPIVAGIARGTFSAPCSIELGVVASSLRQDGDEQLARVAQARQAPAEATVQPLEKRLELHQGIP